MSPNLRKLALTTHVVTSVGWIGAVAVFLALAIKGLSSDNAEVVQAVYISMGFTGWLVIVPSSIVSMVTGFFLSWATPWGFVRHHWIVAKLLITVVAVVVLLVHMQPIDHAAEMAKRAALSGGDLRGVRVQFIVESSAAVAVLLLATALSVYKPQGVTSYGRHLLQANERSRP